MTADGSDGGDGEQQFLPVISGRASAKLNRIAAKMTRPPKQKARPFAKLREEWKPTSARRCWTCSTPNRNSLPPGPDKP